MGCIVPPTQFLFGTDYSFETIEATANLIPDLRLTKDVMDVLERSNAERLFPVFKV